jgi:hypothetical protein
LMAQQTDRGTDAARNLHDFPSFKMYHCMAGVPSGSMGGFFRRRNVGWGASGATNRRYPELLERLTRM